MSRNSEVASNSMMTRGRHISSYGRPLYPHQRRDVSFVGTIVGRGELGLDKAKHVIGQLRTFLTGNNPNAEKPFVPVDISESMRDHRRDMAFLRKKEGAKELAGKVGKVGIATAIVAAESYIPQ